MPFSKLTEKLLQDIGNPRDWVCYLAGASIGSLVSIIFEYDNLPTGSALGILFLITMDRFYEQITKTEKLEKRANAFRDLLIQSIEPYRRDAEAKKSKGYAPRPFINLAQLLSIGKKLKRDKDLWTKGAESDDWFEKVLEEHLEAFRSIPVPLYSGDLEPGEEIASRHNNAIETIASQQKVIAKPPSAKPTIVRDTTENRPV